MSQGKNLLPNADCVGAAWPKVGAGGEPNAGAAVCPKIPVAGGDAPKREVFCCPNAGGWPKAFAGFPNAGCCGACC